jgi:hypothetical protein
MRTPRITADRISALVLAVLLLVWIVAPRTLMVIPPNLLPLLLVLSVLRLASLAMPPRTGPWMRSIITLVAVGVVILLGRQFHPWFFQFELSLVVPNEIPLITGIWTFCQLLLIVAARSEAAAESGLIMHSFHEHGLRATCIEMRRGKFGRMAAEVGGALQWILWILLATVLLWRSNGLEQIESDLLYRRVEWEQPLSAPHSMIVTLTTPDNNQKKYLQTALEITRAFRKAGALVTCVPRRAILDSAAQRIADSIADCGGMTFAQRRPGEEGPDERWRLAYLRFYPVDFFRMTGKPTVHAAIAAVARASDSVVKVSPQLLKNPGELFQHGRTPAFYNASIWLGNRKIPVDREGRAAVLLYGSWIPQPPGWNRSVFRAEFEKTYWDSPLTMFSLVTGKHVDNIPDSLWQIAQGKMVFLKWVNNGEDLRRDDAGVPAMIADRVSSNHVVRFEGEWSIWVACFLLFASGFVAVRARTGVLLAFLVGCTLALLVLDGWLFARHLVVSSLIYPALAMGLAALILPLTKLPDANPRSSGTLSGSFPRVS